VNAAISLRAHATIEPRPTAASSSSRSTPAAVSAATWSALDGDGDLPLLALLARTTGSRTRR
jgi:hypothetical protein